MLYRIEIENFLSIAERQVIDLRSRKSVADPLGRLSPIYPGSERRCPNVAAVFGPNAAGKSNVLRAIAFAAWFVEKSFYHPPAQQLTFQKFGTKEMIGRPTRLALSFTGPVDFLNEFREGAHCPYLYELVVAPRGDLPGPDSVELEKLTCRPRGHGKPTTIFERRSGGRLRYAKGFMTAGQESALGSVLLPGASVISTLAQLNNDIATRYLNWASAVQSNILNGRFEGDDVGVTRWLAGHPEALNQLRDIAKRIDLGITQIGIENSTAEPRMTFGHSGLDQAVDLHLESHGTRQFIKLFPWIRHALDQGRIALIDDIDSCIHPLIVSEVMRWFGNETTNPNGAQLLTTCHSACLLRELTKEEVLFCEKDSYGRTSVYGLAEIEGVRRSENFFGNYITGQYGAVPRVG